MTNKGKQKPSRCVNGQGRVGIPWREIVLDIVLDRIPLKVGWMGQDFFCKGRDWSE